jgi:hypothetical protein
MVHSRSRTPAARSTTAPEAVRPRNTQRYGNAAAAERIPQADATQQLVTDAKDAATGKTSGNEEGKGKGTSRPAPAINVTASSFEDQGLRASTLEKALTAYRTAYAKGDTDSLIFTVIDYDMPSDEKRLFVIDLAAGELLHHELVAHGSGSGMRDATRFSNQEGSNATSLGMSRTAETYHSTKFGGTALRLDGLEEGFNDNMRDRAVVMHQADYATPAAIETNAKAGDRRLGRSQGCPAMDPAVASKVIKTIKNGTLIFSYAPDPTYLKKSTYLNP